MGFRIGKRGVAMAAGIVAAGTTARYLLRNKRRLDLYDKVVLVTGGSRGLGLLLAREFANRGARVAICARDLTELEEAKADMRRRGASVYTHQCDVTDRAQVDDLVAAVSEHVGEVDVLVNNAGIIQVGPTEEMTVEDYDRAMKTHFWGPLYTTLAVLPAMRAKQRGRVVNVSSIGGKIAVPHLVPYSASKFALVGLSEGLRSELVSENIFVTTVCPGLMRTGSPVHAEFKGHNEEEYTWFAIGDSLPVASMSAEDAARKIVDATIYGDAEIVLSFPAKLAAIARALFPEPMADTMALVNQALPMPTGNSHESALGFESETPLTRSPLTSLSQQAARDNNELTNGRVKSS